MAACTMFIQNINGLYVDRIVFVPYSRSFSSFHQFEIQTDKNAIEGGKMI